MGAPADDLGGPRALTLTRLLFVATVIAAVVTGYLGLSTFVSQQDAKLLGTAFWDIAYYDLQLFVLGSEPLETPGPYPPLLEFARFAAPAATLYALYEAARAIFAGQYRRWRNRHRRHHAIVVGDTQVARALCATLRAEGRTVVATEEGTAEALAAAGVAGASLVYACAQDAEDSMLNVVIAQAAATAQRRRRRGTLRVYAHTSDVALALGLRARWLGLAERRTAVDFFCVDELAAQGMLDLGDVSPPPGVRPHILVAGLGTFGQAVVVEYARRWRLRSPRRAERVAMTVVDEAASDVVAQLRERWPVLAAVSDLTPVDATVQEALIGLTGPAPHRVYICYEEEELALTTALTATQLWRGGPNSVVVRLHRLSGHASAFHPSGRAIGDDIGGRLRLVRVTDLACHPTVIAQDLVERLAQATHERYLLGRLAAGVRMDDPEQPAMRDWSQLPESLREANRAHARDIGATLASVGATVAPRGMGATPFVFSPEEEELLAEREHERWLHERRAAGIRRGARRKGVRHPSLVAWQYLPEAEREKDRQTLRGLHDILADVGLQAVRLNGAPNV